MIDYYDTSIVLKEMLRSDWKLLADILIKNNIQCLYHFTNKNNIESINSCGFINSMDQCELDKITPIPGGNKLSNNIDTQKNISDFVHLSIERRCLMFRDKHDIECLKIDPRVIYYKNTIFCDGNAADKYTHFSASVDFFSKLPFDLILDYRNDLNIKEYKKYQAEILIYNSIPKRFFL